MQPSKGLHNVYDSNRISIDNSYFPPELKEASYKVQQYSEPVKQAEWSINPFRWDATQDALGWLLRGAGELNTVSSNLKETGKSIAKATEPIRDPKKLGDNIANGINYLITGAMPQELDPKYYTRLKEDAPLWDKVKGSLAQRPALRPLWFLPAAVGAAGIGWKGGNALVEWLDSLLGKSEQRKEYSEEARRIYNESAKLLKDVASGKIKPKMEKESSLTKTAVTGVAGFGDGNMYILQSILGLIAAGMVAKQLRGVSKGISDSQEELADRTHMLWAALAAQKERDYDYNGLYVDMDPTMIDMSKDKKLNKKTNDMRNNMKPDNDPAQLRWENGQMRKIRSTTYR